MVGCWNFGEVDNGLVCVAGTSRLAVPIFRKGYYSKRVAEEKRAVIRLMVDDGDGMEEAERLLRRCEDHVDETVDDEFK